MKRCSKCGEEKELSAFSPDKRATDGAQSRCRCCCTVAKREAARIKPEMIKAQRRRYRLKRKGDIERYEAHLAVQSGWTSRNAEKVAGYRKKSWAKYDTATKSIWRKNSYENNPEAAARKKAKELICKATGLLRAELPNDLVEAKAAQLMVHRIVAKRK